MSKNPSKQPSQRQLRVGEQIKHVLAETIARGHFHEAVLLDAGITVTEVRVTPDLKNAYAYVLSLGGRDMDKILPALNNEAYFFQKEINRGTQLKFTPKLQFRIDGSFDKVSRIEDVFSTIKYSDQSDQEE